mmetsp:Transcript_35332/g.87813  ORF Transcript_35332/g.87813 Transcript_35332/m.87813 type:complete len:335 (+) Transcript_35332:411-1415(+)
MRGLTTTGWPTRGMTDRTPRGMTMPRRPLRRPPSSTSPRSSSPPHHRMHQRLRAATNMVVVVVLGRGVGRSGWSSPRPPRGPRARRASQKGTSTTASPASPATPHHGCPHRTAMSHAPTRTSRTVPTSPSARLTDRPPHPLPSSVVPSPSVVGQGRCHRPPPCRPPQPAFPPPSPAPPCRPWTLRLSATSQTCRRTSRISPGSCSGIRRSSTSRVCRLSSRRCRTTCGPTSTGSTSPLASSSNSSSSSSIHGISQRAASASLCSSHGPSCRLVISLGSIPHRTTMRPCRCPLAYTRGPRTSRHRPLHRRARRPRQWCLSTRHQLVWPIRRRRHS